MLPICVTGIQAFCG
ncbi:unnamed protein product [Linum tenue]|uniref:Uncharacterized protein n=1 Tax=Linum tenue TaxID=586396 RepID=A0AAV0KGN4_9ROSI|nr:unnamed protein product [Linum tenue]